MSQRMRDLKQFVGRSCAVTWKDRLGREHSKVLNVLDVSCAPPFGAYLVGDVEDVHFDRLMNIQPLD